nr:FUSC family protein [Planosporangium thailandense]
MEALLEAALHVEVEASGPLDPGWADAVRALGPAVGQPPVPDGALPPTGVTTGDALLSRAVLRVRAALAGTERPAAGEEPVGLPPWPGLVPQLRAAVNRHSVILPAAARLAVAVAAGAGLGRALGLDHSYWVGLTVAAVLLASNSTLALRRSVHRVVGTVAGVALAYALLSWHPPLFVIVACVAVIQFAAEMVVTTTYGLAVIGITVLALVLFHLGAPGAAVGTALGSRLGDTVLGAAVALVLRGVLWPRATAARLPQVQARTLRAAGRVLCASWTDDGDRRRVAEERRRLQSALVTLRTVHADALADDRSASPDTDRSWPVTLAVEEFAFLVLSLPRHRRAPEADAARSVGRYVEELSATIDGTGAAVVGTAVGTAEDAAVGAAVGAAPEVPGYPRTSAALGALAIAVAHVASPARPVASRTESSRRR